MLLCRVIFTYNTVKLFRILFLYNYRNKSSLKREWISIDTKERNKLRSKKIYTEKRVLSC